MEQIFTVGLREIYKCPQYLSGSNSVTISPKEKSAARFREELKKLKKKGRKGSDLFLVRLAGLERQNTLKPFFAKRKQRLFLWDLFFVKITFGDLGLGFTIKLKPFLLRKKTKLLRPTGNKFPLP